MDCQEVLGLRGAYIARELSEDIVQSILTHLDLCQACHEAYLAAIAREVEETLARGPALTRQLTEEQIEDERLAQTRRSEHRDLPQSWPVEDFNYGDFLLHTDPDGGPGWWISLRSRPKDRAAWAVTLVIPEGPEARTLLLLLSLGGLYDWQVLPSLECPVRYRKPPDWFLAGRPRHPLAPIWAVVSVAAWLARLRQAHGQEVLQRALRAALLRWLSSMRQAA